jgi:hypothetical protein
MDNMHGLICVVVIAWLVSGGAFEIPGQHWLNERNLIPKLVYIYIAS